MRPHGAKIRAIGGARVKRLVQRYGLRLLRKLGQNFLIDERVIDFIVESAELTPDDRVVEIGCGMGNLTRKIAETGAHVLACEVDVRIATVAIEELEDMPNVRIIVRDALDGKGGLSAPLREGIDELLADGGRLKVVSNLPYCISTPVITTLVEGDLPVERQVLTVQKEVGERLIAKPGTKPYSYLGVTVQLHCETELLKDIAPSAFWPRPEVRSAIVRVRPRADVSIDADTLRGFKMLAKAIFNSRRKTLLNSLGQVGGIVADRDAFLAAFDKLGLEPKVRGERLSPEEMVELARALGLMKSESS